MKITHLLIARIRTLPWEYFKRKHYFYFYLFILFKGYPLFWTNVYL